MAISENNILSFTSQDYQTILEEIKLTKSELMPEYTDQSDTDFGNLILTYCAMLFDILSWKIDYSTNECIPMLSETMKAMYKHCKWIGYKPKSNQAAKATFEITIQNNGEIQSLDKGFKITMEYQINGEYIMYELDENVDCTAPEDVEEDAIYKIQCTGTQGESVSEVIGYSNGKADQDFFITYSPFIEGSLEVEAYNPSTQRREYYKTNENNSFVGSKPTDRVIVLEQVDSTLIKVKFGDGYNGKIPTVDSELIAYYRIGGGVIGNRPIGAINIPISEMPANFISIENITEAVGGVDADNVDTIKEKVSKGRNKTIYSLMRKQDFDNFLYNRSDKIEKFYVCKDTIQPKRLFRPIAIYIKPYNDFVFSEEYKQSLLKEMDTYKLLDDIITIYDCIPIKVVIDIQVMSDGLTPENQLLYTIKYALKEYVDNLPIGHNEEDTQIGLYVDDIREQVRQISGVKRFISLNTMKIKDEQITKQNSEYSDGVSDIVLSRGQLLYIENLDTDINVTFV